MATAIAAGFDFALALTSTGAIYAWGDNFFGDLGDGSTVQSDLPVQVLPPGARAIAIAAGRYHALALITGRPNCVLAWGDNREGEVGSGSDFNPPFEPNGPSETDIPTYTCVPQGTDLTAVAAGQDFSLALTSTGSVYSWGANFSGELGDAIGRMSAEPVPAELPPSTTVTAVAAGSDHVLALTSSGSLLAWGSNSVGQLGDGTTSGGALPVEVRLPRGAPVASIAAGEQSSMALRTDGSILTRGDLVQPGLMVSGNELPSRVTTPHGARLTLLAVGGDFAIATS